MATVLNYDTGQEEELPDAEAAAGVVNGSHALPSGDVPVISPEGLPGTVPAEKAAEALRQGYRLESARETQLREAAERPGTAFAAGAGRGATFGLSDLALTGTGLVKPETLETLKEANPNASVAGEVVGTAASLLVPGGGAVGAVGKVGSLAERGVARALGEGLASRLASKAVGGAVEGGFYGMSSALSESALGDSELSAEKLLSGAGIGAVLGGGLGVLGGAASEGLGVARKRLNELATQKVAGAEAKALAMGEESAAELTASLRGKYGAQAAKASNLLETGNQLVDDLGVSAETKARLASKLASPEAGELREVTARNVLEDFEGQAATTIKAKAAFKDAADSQAARAAAKADELLSPAEAIAQVKARAARYGAPAVGRVVGGTIGTVLGGLPGTAVGALAGDMVGSLAGGQLRPSLQAVKRMFEHPAVVKAFFGAVKKATEESPQVFGRYAGVLSGAAARNASILAATHIALAQSEPDYQQQMAQAGFPFESPEDVARAKSHSAELDRVQRAIAQHDKRMDSVLDGFLRGERAPGGRARLPTEARKDFEARAAELARLAGDPQALAERFSLNPALSVAAPGMSAALAATATRAVGFLHDKAPKNPSSPNMPALTAPWKPTKEQLASWEKYVRAVERPSTVVEDLSAGRATKEAVEALKAVYPKLAADVQTRLTERMANLDTRLPYRQRQALRVLLGSDFDAPSAGARAALQRSHTAAMARETAKSNMPMPAAASRDAASLATSTQRLEGRGGST
jgi:hypothetical protein